MWVESGVMQVKRRILRVGSRSGIRFGRSLLLAGGMGQCKGFFWVSE